MPVMPQVAPSRIFDASPLLPHPSFVPDLPNPPPRPSLEKGEIARFRASLSAPPAQGRSVRVHFAAAVSETTAKGDVSAQRP